jgi:hypothetical protein
MNIRQRSGGRLAAASATPLALLLATLVASAPVTSCGGKSEPTASGLVSCAGFGATSTGIDVPDCGGTVTTDITLFNEFGQAKSMVITCGGTSRRYTITNIGYNSDGTVRSYDVAINNGQTCHYPT